MFEFENYKIIFDLEFFFLEYKIQEIKLLIYPGFQIHKFLLQKCTSFSLQYRVMYSGKKHMCHTKLQVFLRENSIFHFKQVCPV